MRTAHEKSEIVTVAALLGILLQDCSRHRRSHPLHLVEVTLKEEAKYTMAVWTET